MNVTHQETEVVLSICIITYNHEKYIEQAIRSVMDMNIQYNYEIILSDDASIDCTIEIARKYEDKVRVLQNNENVGAVKNLQNVWTYAKGKYFITLEGDDFWLDNGTLKKMIDILEQSKDIIGVAAQRCIANENGEIILSPSSRKYKDFYVDLKKFMHNEMYDWSATMQRKEVLNFYDFDVAYKANRNVADLTFCIMSMIQGKIYLIDDILGVYRCVEKSGENNYNSTHNQWDRFEDHIHILKVLEENYKKRCNFSSKYDFYTQKILHRIKSKEFMPTINKLYKYLGIKRLANSLFNYYGLKVRCYLGKLKRKIIN